MLTSPTLDKLFALNLAGMARALAEQRESPAYTELPFEDRLGLLVDREGLGAVAGSSWGRLAYDFGRLRQARTESGRVPDLLEKLRRHRLPGTGRLGRTSSEN